MEKEKMESNFYRVVEQILKFIETVDEKAEQKERIENHGNRNEYIRPASQ